MSRRVHRAVLRLDADGHYDPGTLCGVRWTAATVMQWGGRGITCPRCARASTAGLERVPLPGGSTALRVPASRPSTDDATDKKETTR